MTGSKPPSLDHTISRDPTDSAALTLPGHLDTLDLEAMGEARAEGGGEGEHDYEEVERVGRYMVLERLGSGAMGVVLAAYDPELDRKVALKLIDTRQPTLDRARARLQREAQALAQLGHPNVVAVHDVGSHEGQLFVAMEFVAGQTLSAWMRLEAASELAPDTGEDADGPRPTRPWREVLEVFAAAGRGLAAAHGAGLVHRDFKPDNVMLGADGRVRVLDFGIARSANEADPPETDASPETRAKDAPAQLTESAAADTKLTRTGALIGTPAYMPAEQFRGSKVDARSDQFSFCASLHEALYGERPYPGGTVGALLYAVENEQLCPPPRDTDVPAWVHRAVVRGLARDPDARWPDMAALLEALADDPAPRRRPLWAGLGLSLILGASIAIVVASARADAQVCTLDGREDAQAELEAVWGAEARARVRAAILDTGLEHAPAVWTQLESRLDAHAEAWVDARVDACEAARDLSSPEQRELSQRRATCLQRDLVHLRATVEEIERIGAHGQSSPPIAERLGAALDSVAALPQLGRCADLRELMAELPPPEDPAAAARAEALDRRLIELQVKHNAGERAAARGALEAVIAEAEALDHAPLLTRAWLRRANLLEDAAEFDEAERAYLRSLELALASGMEREAASAARNLVWLMRYEQARPAEDATEWDLIAGAMTAAVDTDEAWANLNCTRGIVAYTEGDPDRARALLETCLRLREGDPNPDELGIASALNNLAIIEQARSDYAASRELQERALAIRERVLGPEHQLVAASLSNLGSLAGFEQDWENARDRHERALAIRERVLGPEHPDVASSLNNLSNAELSLDNLDAARGYAERALEIKLASRGPDHPSTASTYAVLAMLDRQQGRFDSAIENINRARSVWLSAYGGDNTLVGLALSVRGMTQLDRGRFDEAIADLEAAERLSLANEGDAGELADARFALARALVSREGASAADRTRAVALARQARAVYLEYATVKRRSLAEVEAWLETHAAEPASDPE
ncbi:serine/threonine kinase family protein [Plesiocystis pacifica SIR-1]|uniref:Serine/threonine kinase family protein n=1 Tax=Plesiocystis pacifica SIR-1 TaxID=391625 RepID=A6GCN5_9BACT|nr:tetratricopeptide repeat protein [Plesiocystis pacifica]EDM76387.1 serine/threonine kinase family protein [Plesiocystis pacifica SIR-1]